MILTIEGFTKSYGEKTLFSDVSLSIDPGEHIGIVGVNGAGKSTLLRAIAGLTPLDAGTTTAMRGLRIGYLAQDKELSLDNTVLMEVFHGTDPLMQALRDYEQALAESAVQPEDKQVQERLLQAASLIDEQDGWQLEGAAKSILTRLGLPDYQARVGNLSGGQQKRLALATVLIQPADLLLLDEPTNHLDSESIAWLEEYLRTLPGAVMVVTHDRYFLDAATNRILELDRGYAYLYKGGYTDYLTQRTERAQAEEAAERKRQNFLRRELKWMRRGAQARSTKQQARIDRYEAVKAQSAPEKQQHIEIGLAGSRLGREVIELDHVSFARDEHTYIDDFSYTVLRRDRVGILGGNGVGKTTLLNLIAGRLQPTQGTIKIGQTVKLGYFTQKADTEAMDGRLRAIEYIEEAAHRLTLADGSTISASQLMERFLFPGNLQWTPIERLSGGERRRLQLLRILMSAPNVLLLDEPTNDLDIDTMAVLEDFLDDFGGAILFVSHDRFFVDRLADKVFVYEPGGHLRLYAGGYSYYKAREAAETAAREEQTTPAAADRAKAKPAAAAGTGAKPRPQRPKRLSFQEQREYEGIEDRIASKEGELKATRLMMSQAGNDYGQLNELSQEEQRLSRELDELMDRWAYLSEIAEQSD